MPFQLKLGQIRQIGHKRLFAESSTHNLDQQTICNQFVLWYEFSTPLCIDRQSFVAFWQPTLAVSGGQVMECRFAEFPHWK